MIPVEVMSVWRACGRLAGQPTKVRQIESVARRRAAGLVEGGSRDGGVKAPVCSLRRATCDGEAVGEKAVAVGGRRGGAGPCFPPQVKEGAALSPGGFRAIADLGSLAFRGAGIVRCLRVCLGWRGEGGAVPSDPGDAGLLPAVGTKKIENSANGAGQWREMPRGGCADS